MMIITVMYIQVHLRSLAHRTDEIYYVLAVLPAFTRDHRHIWTWNDNIQMYF